MTPTERGPDGITISWGRYTKEEVDEIYAEGLGAPPTQLPSLVPLPEERVGAAGGEEAGEEGEGDA